MAIDIDRLVQALNEEVVPAREKRGGQIGASAVGSECDALLALALRGFPESQLGVKTKRIFEAGHMLEPKIVRDLRAAGLHVMDKNPLTGKQWFFEAYSGHVVCWLDGLVEDGEQVINLEIKTMNKQRFSALKRKGVAVSDPHYMAQMQMQMALSGIHQTMFVALCKDNSEYWIEPQLVQFDQFVWGYQKARIERAMQGDVARIAQQEDDWRCQGCSKRVGCWGHMALTPLCRYCANAVPDDGGGWFCALHQRVAEDACPAFKPFAPRARQ